jgi:hypothetical protein
MSSILQELEAQIANVSTSVEKTNIGIVRETGDGVAKVEGLSDAQLNEMIEFPGGLTGLALNLEAKISSGVSSILLVSRLTEKAMLALRINTPLKRSRLVLLSGNQFRFLSRLVSQRSTR